MDVGATLSTLLGFAVLIPLASFTAIFLFGPRMGKHGAGAGYVATGAILFSFLLSVTAMVVWLSHHAPLPEIPHEVEAAALGELEGEAELIEEGEGAELAEAGHAHAEHGHHEGVMHAYTADWYTLAKFGKLRLSIGYYIDALTIAMFCMVTLIASCIHFYATGYMHDELHEYVDHEVTLSDGHHLHRPGRYHRFFQYLSLFCFSMLGLVIAGNVAMTFVFWELVGICSYFLIGFYVERKSASTAANKAFIVNRVGDFGMLIGLMAIWSAVGTFNYGDINYGEPAATEVATAEHDDEASGEGASSEGAVAGEMHEADPPAGDAHELEHAAAGAGVEPGLFSLIRPADRDHKIINDDGSVNTPTGFVELSAGKEIASIVERLGPGASDEDIEAAIAPHIEEWRQGEGDSHTKYGYWLLVVAGVGVFCGCVGKSAQFPLHVWLPDAMEGPTPVSALVHSATMVAAGVFLVARFYPVFVPEVLLVIAITGAITLFMAATIAITAVDIKRVLAYSTVSQLGYMMLALGLGGWLAGVLHLFTHAFFKSLLFMGSGSVIHAVHTNDMREMGGLRKKMPWTAYTMLIGCLAIAGAGIPLVIGFSGFYSKDAILEQALSFGKANKSGLGLAFFLAAAGGAAITSFYMFRLWFMTFAGKPRNKHAYDHAHESPPSMFVPLIVTAFFAVAVAWKPTEALMGVVLIGGGLLIGVAVLKAVTGKSFNSLINKPIMVALGLCALVVLVSLPWLTAKHVTLVTILEQARPTGTLSDTQAVLHHMRWPNEHASHADSIKTPAGLVAFGTASAGFLLALVFYGLRLLDAGEVKQQFGAIYKFLWNKWYFDELYQIIFINPVMVISKCIAWFDRCVIDKFIDNIARAVRAFATFWEWLADRTIVEGIVNGLASRTYALGNSLRGLQTGKVRQYVLFIVVGTIGLFMLVSFFWGA